MRLETIVRAYCRTVSHHPYIALGAILALVVTSVLLAGNVQNVSSNQRDFLPEGLPVIEAFELLEDEFGGTESAMIAIELDPQYAGSNEPRDIRDPEVIRYTYLVHQMAATIDDVLSVSSAASVLKSLNNDVLPRDRHTIINLSEGNAIAAQYISPDNTMVLVKLSLSDQYDEEDLVEDMEDVIAQVLQPPGLLVQPAGEPVTGPVIMRSLGPDQARTGQFSLLAILIILFLLMRSVRYALTPLSVIVVGVIFTFGYLGLRGLAISPQTSGVISMIMGIGIDFGIQTVTRYRYELQKAGPRNAMNNTMCRVLMPMATTTVAALIGFRAMGMGQLTFIEELGRYMSYGITASFIAAITVLPAILVITEQLKQKYKNWRKGGTKK